jgi:hypothetical protein
MANILNMHQHKEEKLKEKLKENLEQDKPNEIIDELQKYMLYSNKYNKPMEKIDYIKKLEKVEKLEKVDPSSKNDFFYPEQKDQLFWCYYIIKNGFAAYEYPGTTSYANEKKGKFECIELLRKNKQTLKENKIKNIKEDVEDELAQKSMISRKTFIALCSIEKQNVLYIENNKYFDIFTNLTNALSYHVVHCIKGKYCIETDISQDQIEKYKSTLFKCDNFEKPLKAISYYKLNELVDICKYLVLVDDFNKKTKKELYELLMEKL